MSAASGESRRHEYAHLPSQASPLHSHHLDPVLKTSSHPMSRASGTSEKDQTSGTRRPRIFGSDIGDDGYGGCDPGRARSGLRRRGGGRHRRTPYALVTGGTSRFSIQAGAAARLSARRLTALVQQRHLDRRLLPPDPVVADSPSSYNSGILTAVFFLQIRYCRGFPDFFLQEDL